MTDLRDAFTDLWEGMGAAPKSERLTLKASNPQPFVGEVVVLQWRAQGLGLEVKIFCDDVLLIDGQELTGQHTITADDLWQKTYRAECGEAQDMVTIATRVRQPQCHYFTVPQSVNVGQNLQVEYSLDDVQTLSVMLFALGEEQPLETLTSTETQGQLSLPMPKPGQFKLQLVASSEHGHWAPLATIKEERIFSVSLPCPQIAVFEVDGAPLIDAGAELKLCWQVTHSTEVFLQQENAKRFPVESEGSLLLEPATCPGVQTVVLHALNSAGEAVCQTLSIPWAYPDIRIDFASSHSSIQCGATHQLQWQLSGARAVKIYCDYGNDATLLISQESAATAAMRLYDDVTYRLMAEAMDGEIHQRQLSVSVDMMPLMSTI